MWQPSRLNDRHRNGWTDITRLKLLCCIVRTPRKTLKIFSNPNNWLAPSRFLKLGTYPDIQLLNILVKSMIGISYVKFSVRPAINWCQLYQRQDWKFWVWRKRESFLVIWHAGRKQVPILFNPLLIFGPYLTSDVGPLAWYLVADRLL